MSIKINEDELRGVLAEVEQELANAMKSQKLSKAVGPMEDEATTEPPPEESPDMGGAPPPEEGGAPPPEEGGAPGQISQADIEALAAEYASLPPEELEVHAMAIDAALQMVMGGGGAPPPGAEGGAPPPPPGGGAPPPPGGAPMAMSEYKIKEDLKKTEAEIEKKVLKKYEEQQAESDKRFEMLQSQVAGLVKALDIVSGSPMRKAITDMSHISKPGSEISPEEAVRSLSKSDIDKRLTERTRDRSMKKSDRELVNQYYAGEVSVEGISHLLSTKE